ncbi:MAG: radical SAM protein [Candidatus Parvarchaeota archaeon]|nr:radical SAM protein [Candidatus Jingweiarchaeum tengchongense]MCW1297720.1 radical SAM protein [Candidatus Jingweiarchaeum tengchongense]MCW1304299.1 radical SAM protein [Candidatus Jingweiarchaeum tengchongense]MCW1305326.1 radical SAM protein [Candidatus Jingweiarchaeum tengchongense]MCW1311143.1 radical SAM protein [Candidatus Jingweiarchaeum tengchongense]
MKCKICGRGLASNSLQVCLDCIRNDEDALKLAKEAHKKSREKFGLVAEIPNKGIKCKFCGNECEIPRDESGFCGLVRNVKNRIIREDELIATTYYDPHPTNCVAQPFCAGGSGAGYPRYAIRQSAEYGYFNLSVFCIGCNFDCLFCQNWQFRKEVAHRPKISDDKFLGSINNKTTCICFFGGDPSPQLDKITRICEKASERKKGILRFCLETNGNANTEILKRFAEISLRSGGGIKFDLKAFDENLNIALCGVSNKKTKENFKALADCHKERPEVPFLRASTLLVPYYIDEEEISKIANFIAKIDKTIPYVLLAYHPMFEMDDVGFTKKEFAMKCLKIAKEQGLERVRIGNYWLLE